MATRRGVVLAALLGIVLALTGPTVVPGHATGPTASATTGSEGAVVDGWGGLHTVSFGASPTISRFDGAPYWNGWDIVRGVALRTGDSTGCATFGGYTLDGLGGLHAFGINGHARPSTPTGGPYWKGWDIARGIALVPADPRNPASPPAGGFVLDGFGGLHYFTTNPAVAPPTIAGAPYWNGWDIARGIVILTDAGGYQGGFVVDAWGGLHPFGIGPSGAPPTFPPAVTRGTAPYWKGWDIARGVAALPGSGVAGGLVLDGWGALHPFGIAPSSGSPDGAQLRGAPSWPGRDLARGVSMTPVAPAGCGPSADWTSRLFDPGHGGRVPDTGLTASNVGALREKWRLQPPACNGVTTGAVWFATPVTFHGVIYIGSDYGCLYAINEATGVIIWSRFSIFQPVQTCQQPLGIVSSINVQDDGAGNPVLYFHAPDGYLYKLRGSDGSTVWQSLVQIPSSSVNDVYAWSSPTVANGKVIIGVSSNCDTPFVQGQVRAYDAGTGALLWVHKTIPDGFVGAGDWYDAAVDGNGDVYVSTGSTTVAIASAHQNTTPGFEQYSILKLNGNTGTLIWKAPAPAYQGDPDYGTSPVLFEGGGVGLVGAWNKDGWFRAFRQDNGAEAWQAKVGSVGTHADDSLSGGAVFDGNRLFVVSNNTNVGGTWSGSPGLWVPTGGLGVAGSIRELDPVNGNLVRRSGVPFEIGLPADVMGPCSINARGILVCAGGQLIGADIANGHNNGLYIVDTNAPTPGILAHLEDRNGSTATQNYGEFSQPIQKFGSIIAANNFFLMMWGP